MDFEHELKQEDPEIFAAIDDELKRQQKISYLAPCWKRKDQF